jgi:DNA-binding LytR/AlgR family response regulator
MVQTESGESIVRFDQIEYLEASRNYVVVHAEGQENLVRDTLGNLERKLAGGNFARTHRSFIISLDKIAETQPTNAGAHRIRLESGAEVPLSRGFRDGFKSLLTA